jgi:hypothetical protein
MLAESPVGIHAGGDYLDGRIFFATRSRVDSYQLPKRRQCGRAAAKWAASDEGGGTSEKRRS